MILIIDNYDSFTYNLMQYIGSINDRIKVIKNDELIFDEIKELAISHIVISPGPGNPKNTGISLQIIKKLSPMIPTLGICLGHQLMALALKAKTKKRKRIAEIISEKFNKKIETSKIIITLFTFERFGK